MDVAGRRGRDADAGRHRGAPEDPLGAALPVLAGYLDRLSLAEAQAEADAVWTLVRARAALCAALQTIASHQAPDGKGAAFPQLGSGTEVAVGRFDEIRQPDLTYHAPATLHRFGVGNRPHRTGHL